MLKYYDDICKKSKVLPRRILLSFAPVSSKKNIDFLKWLGVEIPKKTEKHLIEIAYKYELPLVATNDVCFLEPEMQNAHEVLMCIEAGLTISNPDRKVITPNHYFKNMNEMIDLFNDIPEATSNTINISRRCHFRPKTSKPMLPAYETLSGKNEKEELKNLSEKGLKLRLNQIDI